MASYFTHFSCLLPVGSDANLQAAINIYRTIAAEREAADETLGFVAEAQSRDQEEGYQVWLYSEEDGEPEDVIAYVFRCAEALSLSGIWGFRWCLSCSRPRLDGYGGGAQVLDLGTQKTIDWIDLDDWLSQQADAYQLAKEPVP